MAHWAEIDENNLVIQVLVLGDDKTSDWLVERFGGTWIQTSYTGAIRKNFAGIGMTYDPELDAFIPPKPFDSWVLNEETAQWEAPVEYPTDGFLYHWNEELVNWEQISDSPYPTDGKAYFWNEETISWDEVPETTD